MSDTPTLSFFLPAARTAGAVIDSPLTNPADSDKIPQTSESRWGDEAMERACQIFCVNGTAEFSLPFFR